MPFIWPTCSQDRAITSLLPLVMFRYELDMLQTELYLPGYSCYPTDFSCVLASKINLGLGHAQLVFDNHHLQ